MAGTEHVNVVHLDSFTFAHVLRKMKATKNHVFLSFLLFLHQFQSKEQKCVKKAWKKRFLC